MKTAVILAARKEADSKIPYPLLSFSADAMRPECLMDRHISMLKGVGINNIIIVTGFCAEMFERYRDDSVKLVFNPDYAFTSSMASLAMAAEYVNEDFLLIESDVIYERKLLDKLMAAPFRNCLTVVNECGNGDEAFVETDGNIIVKISKDIHQMNRIDGEMIGISKISLETFRRMLLKWENNSNLRLNYEYLFLDCTEKHERQYIKYPDLLWCEVDNAVDFKRLKSSLYSKLCRREDPFNHQNIASHLKKIFPEADVENDLTIEPIGGMTNRNFKVTLGGKSYVLRVPGNGTSGMVERKNEEVNSMLAHRMGISPDILYFNGETGVKLTEFIEGAETLNPATVQRYENLLQIADIFRTLHNSSVRMNNDFNVFREILSYENLLAGAGAVMYDGYDNIRDEVFALQDRLNDIGVELRPCHNDLVAENFIKDKNGRIYLIDWEYSGMNDPMWDFAALFLESDFSETNRSIILKRYFGGMPDEAVMEKILIYQILMDVLWSIWTCIKEAQGDDFGTYGMDRYSRALDNMKILGGYGNAHC